jgi:putative heme iron utilization protein
LSSSSHGSSPGRHASGASAESPAVPEPTYAERARTLVEQNRLGSLSTVSRKHPGWPFGSVMPYGLDPRGRPIFLISTMAMHTQNILAEPRASLLISEATGPDDALGAGRITLMGRVTAVAEADRAVMRERYLERYENAKYWVDYEDFAFYVMDVFDVYFVGGFGVMGWVPAEEYLAAEPDPLAGSAGRIISHMNEDHVDAMMMLAKIHAGINATKAQMTAVDRLGFHLRLTTPEGMKGARIAFSREVRTAQEAREVLVEMVKEARSA